MKPSKNDLKLKEYSYTKNVELKLLFDIINFYVSICHTSVEFMYKIIILNFNLKFEYLCR